MYNELVKFNIALHGAAIAFYAIFSTAPLVIIFVWIISIILGSEMGHAHFQETLTAIVGPDLSQSVHTMAESTVNSTSGFWSSLFAIITLLFGATTLLSQMKQTLNKIWGVQDLKMGTIWQFLWDRFMGLLFLGALSILFFAGLLSESILYGLEYILNPLFGSEKIFLIQIGSGLVNIVLAFTFFAAMFKILPDLRIRLRDIAVGAMVTTLLVIVGKALVGWYLSASGLEPAYKAAGSFIIYLIWIYYNVQVVLVGAIFTKVYTKKYGEGVQPLWNAELNEDWE